MDAERNERNDRLAQTAQHALSCPSCKKRVRFLWGDVTPFERDEILCWIERHEAVSKVMVLHI